jgi:TniQ
VNIVLPKSMSGKGNDCIYESNATNTDVDVWNDQSFVIPARSKFYHLEPRGIGTSYVESLSGYAARLAQEHFVTPNALLKEVIPLASSLKMMLLNHSTFHRAINGAGVIASSFVKALEMLTMRRDLTSTTMVTWVGVIPDHSLIRTNRAWCPECYEGWRERGEVVYDPLLWTFQAVAICPLHRIPLISSCPKCKAHLLHLSSRSRPGFCTHCKAWLGCSTNDASSDNFFEIGENIRWQLWKAESIGVLLANAANITVPARQQIAKSLRYCINTFSQGRTSYFASQVGVRLKNVQSWLRGERLPILQATLQITYSLGVQLVPFLCGSSEIGDASLNKETRGTRSSVYRSKMAALSHDEVKIILTSAVSNERPKPLQEFVRLAGWSRGKLENHFPGLCAAVLTRYADYFYRRIDEAKALAILRAAIKETPPPSIVVLAQRIDCNAVSLRYRFPDITRELVSRYKSYWRNTDWEFVEARLKEVLSNDPPSSMSETARSLELAARGIRQRFPELTRAIAERFEKYVKDRMERRKEELRQEIRHVVSKLKSEGIYPSVKRVAARVKASRNMLEIRLTLRTIKSESTSNLVS